MDKDCNGGSAGDFESDQLDGGHKQKRVQLISAAAPKDLSQHCKALQKVIARQVASAAVAEAAAKVAKSAKILDSKPCLTDGSKDRVHGRGRTPQQKPKDDRTSSGSSTNDARVQNASVQFCTERRTPDHVGSLELRRSTCRRHGSSTSGKLNANISNLLDGIPASREPQPSDDEPVEGIADRIPLSLILKNDIGKAPQRQQAVPQQLPFHHFKHYDHCEHLSPTDFLLSDSGKGSTKLDLCCRPRSASTGNRLSDPGSDHLNNSSFSQSLDEHLTSSQLRLLDDCCHGDLRHFGGGSNPDCFDGEEVFLVNERQLASLTSCVTSASSKSEKSSCSSPSADNSGHGMDSFLLKQAIPIPTKLCWLHSLERCQD